MDPVKNKINSPSVVSKHMEEMRKTVGTKVYQEKKKNKRMLKSKL